MHFVHKSLEVHRQPSLTPVESAVRGSARVKRSSKTTGKPKQKGTQQSIDSVNQELLLCGSSYYVPGFVKEVNKTEQSCPLILLSGKGL